MSTGKKRVLVYVIMILSLMVSWKMIKDIVRLSKADERIVKAEEELVVAENEREDLKKRLAEVDEGQWWEEQVRNTLKMGKSNEVVVIVPEQLLKTKEEEWSKEGELATENESNFKKWLELFVY